MIAAVTGNPMAWSGDIRARRKGGVDFDIQVSAAVNRNSDGETVGGIFSFVDISDRKRADEAEREAERRRVMLESLGAACHHLGQPATVLLANLGIMKKKLEGNDDGLVHELVDGSIKAMETLGEILHKLNTVNEYKTTRYLENLDGLDSPSNRIIQI
jgi:PAS domain-containing protein